jgi:transcriptional regulator with XRE-family HTH domain
VPRPEITGYHTPWARPRDAADDPERSAIRESLAFGKALYDIRTALGLTVAELAVRAAMTDDDIERIEEGGTEPTIPLLRRLAAALNADVRLTGGQTSAPSGSKPTPPNHHAGGNTDTALVRAGTADRHGHSLPGTRPLRNADQVDQALLER